MTSATAARTSEGFVRLAPLPAAAVAVAEVVVLEVAAGAPGLLVVVDSAITDSRADDGKKETVSPSGSNTPFQATE